jgi:hypothetical protein
MLGRPGGLRSDQLDTERVREPARDLALQDKQIVRVAVEPIRPSLRRPLSTSLVRQVAAVNNAGQLPLGLLMCANMGTIVNDEIR